MPELIVDPVVNPDAVELATLRKLRDELLTSKHALKARVVELESQALQLVEARDKAQSTVRAVVVEQPLKRMAAELNKNLPEFVMRELLEDYSFDASSDGAILMKSKVDSKLAQDKDGNPIAWERGALHKFLTGDGIAEKTERQVMYSHLLGVRVGSGGIGRTQTIRVGSTEEKKIPTPSFGLR